MLGRYADYYNLDIDIEDGQKAYAEYMAGNVVTENFGGAKAGGVSDGPTSVWTRNEDSYTLQGYGFKHEIHYALIEGIKLFALIAVFCFIIPSIRHRRFYMPFFFWTGRGHRHHHTPHHHHRPPTGGFGGMGSRGGFGAGRSGGFGGSRGGGGRTFGGGAGRGRR